MPKVFSVGTMNSEEKEMKKQRCIIIGSSPDADAAFIGSCIKADDFVICADGGLEYARKNDIIPDLLKLVLAWGLAAALRKRIKL